MKKKNQPTKARILDAAEELIIESGFEAAKISTIAKKAGVSDALAYKYFKGKDDIIFSVVAKRTNEVIALIHEHLREITDPRLMLREMIWCMLKYNDSHRNHAKNLLFQCRTNKNFYKSKAHSSVRKYESIISGILNQGVQEGVFSSDINMKFIMYMIWGTIDSASLDNMFGIGTDESVNDLDSIMSLLFSVLEKKQVPAHTDRKQAIMNAAEKIFAEEGFANAKTAAIAKMAGVAESAIYDYFTGKEELLFAISDWHLYQYLDRISSIFNNQRYDLSPSPVKKLWAVMSSFCLSLTAHKDFMKIYFMNTFFNSRYYENYLGRSSSLPLMFKFNNLLDNIINEGKSDGIFRADVNPRTFRFMLMGSYAHLVLRWIIIEHRKFDKYSEIHDLMILLLTAVLKDPSDLDYLITIEL